MNAINEYVPEKWTMLKDSIYSAQHALRCGIENTQELLSKHEIDLGRTTRSNRMTAERLEREIDQMRSALNGILNPFAE